MVTADPIATNPDHYRLVWENEFVRVLDYTDEPGQSTRPHDHPNTVMVTLSDFSRELRQGDSRRHVELTSGQALWLPAQTHSGANVGSTPTHTLLIELKGAAAAAAAAAGASAGELGPTNPGPPR